MDAAPFLESVYREVKSWSIFVAIVGGVYRLVDWFKTLKTNDLHHIQLGIDGLQSAIHNQTAQFTKSIDSLVNEIREQRQDIRDLK